jgi:hypothetical protein
MNNTSQFSQPSFTHLTSFNTLPVMSKDLDAEFEKSFGISLDKTKKTAKKYAVWSILGSIVVFLLSVSTICFILWFLVYIIKHA